MENVRGRMNMKLCTSGEKMCKYTSNPLFQSCKKFGPNLVGIQLLKEEVLLDRPVYIGQAVLDLSKLVMYQLRYEKMAAYAQQFGGDIRIVGGDTDSFFLEIKNISLSQQLLPAMVQDNLLDTSNYPPTHRLYSTSHKAQLGCVKDESAGEPLKEGLFLRPKLYSVLTEGGKAHKRAKGIQRSVVSQSIVHEDYAEVFNCAKEIYREVRGFRSQLHTITTTIQRKKALSLWEDKRAWVTHNTSHAFGHYSFSTPPPPKRARIE
jgi:hypothetical protein